MGFGVCHSWALADVERHLAGILSRVASLQDAIWVFSTTTEICHEAFTAHPRILNRPGLRRRHGLLHHIPRDHHRPLRLGRIAEEYAVSEHLRYPRFQQPASW